MDPALGVRIPAFVATAHVVDGLVVRWCMSRSCILWSLVLLFFATFLRVIWSSLSFFNDSAADLAPRLSGAFFPSLHCSLGTRIVCI